MTDLFIGFFIGCALTGAVWFYRAKILGYASQEVEQLKARIKALGGKV